MSSQFLREAEAIAEFIATSALALGAFTALGTDRFVSGLQNPVSSLESLGVCVPANRGYTQSPMVGVATQRPAARVRQRDARPMAEPGQRVHRFNSFVRPHGPR